ncbi:transformer 2 beta [Kickxella alabastrina]|uniref:Transformer 2 beta n=1 Tax=Kickxella alabastrina TaxID=61397 RepID=A0ACC1IM31_9FUNG|nr:transformer 2 beta [Kickxella alabastrina]
MSKGNPILPSEPLALEPNLITAAAAAQAESLSDNDGQASSPGLSPGRANMVKQRMDNRHYGRSESRERSPKPERSVVGSRDEAMRLEASPYRRRSREDDNYKRGGRSFSPVDYRRYAPDNAVEYGEGRRHRSRGNGRSPREGGESAGYYNGGRDGSRGRRPDIENKEEPIPSRVLGIFGMSKFTNEQNLEELFGKYGPIEKIQIIRDPNDGRSRGYAFINMTNVVDAQEARNAITGTMLHDRKVRVDFSITNKPHASTPGKYKGQDTGAGEGSNRPYQRHDGRRPPRNGGFGGGSSYRDNDDFHARRRANTRDRRRREYPRRDLPPPPVRGGPRAPWSGRSKSPAYRRDPSRGHDSYRGSYEHRDGGPKDYGHANRNGPEGRRNGHREFDNGPADRRNDQRDFDHGSRDHRNRQRDFDTARPYARSRSRSHSRGARAEFYPPPATTRPPPPPY